MLPQNNIACYIPPSDQEEPLRRLERRYAVLLFALGIGIYFLVNVHRVAVPGQLFNELQRDFSMSASAVANLGSVFMYIYAATQLLVGLLVDKYGGMRVLAAGSTALSLGALLFPLAQSVPMLLCSRMLVGLGCGAAYLCLIKETDRLFSRNFAAVTGLVIFLGYSGGVVGTMPLVKLTALIGWRACLMTLAISGILIQLVMIACWRCTRQPQIKKGSISLKPYLTGFRNLNNLRQVFSFAANFGIYYTVLTVLGKKFLEDVAGLSAGVAAVTCSLMVVISAVLNQATGLLCTYTGNLRRPYFRVLNFFPLLALALLLLLLLGPGPASQKGAWFIVAFLLLCITSGFSPITNALAREINPPEATGVAVGILNFAAYVMVAVFANLSGFVLDCFRNHATAAADGAVIYPQAAYLTLFGLLFLTAAGTFCISLTMPETYGRNIYQGKRKIVSILGRIKLVLQE